jgi:hypothetical protein
MPFGILRFYKDSVTNICARFIHYYIFVSYAGWARLNYKLRGIHLKGMRGRVIYTKKSKFVKNETARYTFERHERARYL